MDQSNINKSPYLNFLGSASLLFYLLIWFFNPINKVALLLSIILLIILTVRLKNLTHASFFTYLLTSILPMGKKYLVILHTLQEFPDLKILYPQGLTLEISITIADVIFAFFLLSLFVELAKNGFHIIKNIKLESIDLLILSFFAYGIFADLFSSSYPYLSLLLKKGVAEIVTIYLVLRFYYKQPAVIFHSIVIIFSVIVFFESFLAIQQFIISSPLGKNFEIYHSIEAFGSVADEVFFAFRPLGTFGHANALGLFLASVLPILFFFVIQKNSYPIIYISFFLSLIVLVLTLSRSALFAFFIAIGYLLFIFEHKLKINLIKLIPVRKAVFIILLFFPLFIYLLPRVARTVYSSQASGGLTLRIKQITQSMELLESYPLTGVGTGMSVVSIIERNKKGVFTEFPSPIHNYYFLLAVENGLPSLTLMLIIIVIIIRNFISANTPLTFAFVSVVIVVILGGLFQPFFDFSLLLYLSSFNFAKIRRYENT